MHHRYWPRIILSTALFLPLLLLLVALLLSGCADASYWYAKTFYGIDCRPEKLQNGYCVPANKGGNDAQKTAQP